MKEGINNKQIINKLKSTGQIIHFLKKIGILRVGGAKGTYKIATEQPGGIIGDDYIYDHKDMLKKSEEDMKKKEEKKDKSPFLDADQFL